MSSSCREAFKSTLKETIQQHIRILKLRIQLNNQHAKIGDLAIMQDGDGIAENIETDCFDAMVKLDLLIRYLDELAINEAVYLQSNFTKYTVTSFYQLLDSYISAKKESLYTVT